MHYVKWIVCFSVLFCLQSNPTLEARYNYNSSRADYVIVGVGTSGAVLAKKLTDDKETSVIALHNGENLNDDPDIKYTENSFRTLVSALFGSPMYESGATIPQPNADNRELLWTLALPEGGASAINAGVFARGTNELYSQWEMIAGPEWSVSRILDTYKDLEHYYGNTDNTSARGYYGPLTVRQNPSPSQVSLKFTNATIQATGLPFLLDYNNPATPIGVSSQLQYTQSVPTGEFRVSSSTAFLNSNVISPDGLGINGRKLKIFYGSLGLRTIWKGNKAVGVEYLQNGEIKKAYANKGVIICAGLKSSSFLMHSGIGPKSLLDTFEIPVIFDNPNVGQGLADHPHVLLLFTSNPADADPNPSGVFANIAWLPAPGGDPSKRALRLSTMNPIPGITCGLLDLCMPKSRGSIAISGYDPLLPPLVDLGNLTDPSDLRLYQEALQVYVKAIHKALQTIDPQYRLIYPDPAILEDADKVKSFVKKEIGSNHHYQSHCRMAPLDQGGVVDSTGHVYGVDNLIVADNSIVPVCMDGGPMATAYLIGANIARILLHK